MIDIKYKKECSGCEACSNACPVDAIVMETDELGFKYPKVNMDTCINCNKCEIVCPFINKPSVSTPSQCFAVRNTDINVVKRSRSGGVFTALAEEIISRGGIVVGCVMIDPYTACHVISDNMADCALMCGSKYIQSNINDIYKRLLPVLKEGREVLFTGTPCQVSGLKRMINKRYHENLFFVDIICHGVSSPSVWKSYLNYLGQRLSDTPLSVNFRNKQAFGWDMHRESILWKDSGEKVTPFTFYNDIWLRPACHDCPFASISREGDITLGDLWSYKNVAPEMNSDNMGVSSVLINSEKGIRLFSKCMDKLSTKTLDIDDVKQPNLLSPTPVDRNTRRMVQRYIESGYESCLRKMGIIGWRRQRNKIIKRVKRFWRL